MLCEALQRQGVQLLWGGRPLRLGEAPLAGSPLQRLAGAAATAGAARAAEPTAVAGAAASSLGSGAAARPQADAPGTGTGTARIGPRAPSADAEAEVVAAHAAFWVCLAELARHGATEACHHVGEGLAAFGLPQAVWWGRNPWELPGFEWLEQVAEVAKEAVRSGAAHPGLDVAAAGAELCGNGVQQRPPGLTAGAEMGVAEGGGGGGGDTRAESEHLRGFNGRGGGTSGEGMGPNPARTPQPQAQPPGPQAQPPQRVQPQLQAQPLRWHLLGQRLRRRLARLLQPACVPRLQQRQPIVVNH
jgi:hypothetical protein